MVAPGGGELAEGEAGKFVLLAAPAIGEVIVRLLTLQGLGAGSDDAALGLDLAEHAGRVMAGNMRRVSLDTAHSVEQQGAAQVGYVVRRIVAALRDFGPPGPVRSGDLCRLPRQGLVLVQPGAEKTDEIHHADASLRTACTAFRRLTVVRFCFRGKKQPASVALHGCAGGLFLRAGRRLSGLRVMTVSRPAVVDRPEVQPAPPPGRHDISPTSSASTSGGTMDS